MRTITFSAIKGGVGKSSIAILTANLLAVSTYRVLCIDADPQNSMSFYYLPDNLDISESLSNVLKGGNISDNIIVNIPKGISIIPSSLELITCRDIELDALSKSLETVKDEYDFCIIDTAPNFDNVALNCLTAADYIITPVQFSNFDYKSAVFYQNLLSNLGIAEKWKILFNKFKNLKIGGSVAAEYLALYGNTFNGHIFKSRIPESAVIKQYFDTNSRISMAKNKINIHKAITGFASEISNEILVDAETF